MAAEQLEQLDRAAVAARTGLDVGTLDTYRRRGKMPEPDGYIGRSPWWSGSTVNQWDSTRRKGAGKPPGSKTVNRKAKVAPAKKAAARKAPVKKTATRKQSRK